MKNEAMIKDSVVDWIHEMGMCSCPKSGKESVIDQPCKADGMAEALMGHLRTIDFT